MLLSLTKPFRKNMHYYHETVPLKSYSIVITMYTADYDYICSLLKVLGFFKINKICSIESLEDKTTCILF